MEKIFKQSYWGVGISPFRMFGFLTQTNSITLTDTSVIAQKGLFTTQQIEIPYSQINSVTIKQSINGRLHNYGDVTILTSNDVRGITFKGIQQPNELRAEIQAKRDNH